MENRIVWVYKNNKNKREFTFIFEECYRKDMEAVLSKEPDFVLIKEEIISDEEKLKKYNDRFCLKMHIDKGAEIDA